MGDIQQTHRLVRTSPSGKEFVGRCALCGETDLPAGSVFESCPNPRGVSSERAVLDAVEGAKDEGVTREHLEHLKAENAKLREALKLVNAAVRDGFLDAINVQIALSYVIRYVGLDPKEVLRGE